MSPNTAFLRRTPANEVPKLRGLALVTGATGFIGRHVVHALLSRGVRVRALARPRSAADHLREAGAQVVPGDVTDEESVRRAVDGCDYVFHVAALYTFSAPDPREVYRVNVDGTRVVLGAARHARRIVFTSTVGALGLNPDGLPSDEGTPVRERDLAGAYKRSKFRAQEIAHELARDGYPIVVVNPTAPVGPFDVKPTPTGRMIVDYMRGRMAAYVDTGLNLVAVEDVAEAHCLAAERGRVGERYILGHSNFHLREIFGELARLTGIPAPRRRLPHWVPLTAAFFSTAAARCLGRPPALSLEQVRLSTKFMYFTSRKAIEELGMPQSPPVAALERAVRWFRDSECGRRLGVPRTAAA